MFKNKYKVWFLFGVLEKSNDSEWGATSFAQPKLKVIMCDFLFILGV